MAEAKVNELDEAAAVDPCTFANVHEVKLTHTHLNLSVDFGKHILSGNADLSFKSVSDDVSELILDTRDLAITAIYLTKDAERKPLKYEYLEGNAKVPSFGKPLRIELQNALQKDGEVQVSIAYSTSPSAEAIQWLNAEQTHGKKLPYLFTQCQPIGARTLLPTQDSPSAKNTYSAAITVSDPKLVALMSALPDGDDKAENKQTVTYTFKQAVPCCSYLIALVVGELDRRDVGKRCAVYAEPGMVEAAEYEFGNTEKMLDIAESICGKFVWGRYDVLLLPPSFPYGGMENPNLTFVTPTLIAGDRSLENVVAHEITHSWTGNLVTNTSWEHFWLNEGWTRFIEGKIMGKLRGPDHEKLDIANSQVDLRKAVNRLGADHEFTKLNLSLVDTDPDDAFSSIPYEKGSEFLRFLEDLVGESEFARFIKVYLGHFSFKCLDSYRFKAFFLEHFKDSEAADKLKAIEWDQWLKAPGMPPRLRKVESKLIADAQALTAKWSGIGGDNDEFKATEQDLNGWSVDQVTLFLDGLLADFQKMASEGKMDKAAMKVKEAALKAVYKFDESKNAEILFRFNLIALECDDEGQYDSVSSMLGTIGRMKFVRPLYKALIKNPDRKGMAAELYAKHKNFYHPICAKMVGQDLA